MYWYWIYTAIWPTMVDGYWVRSSHARIPTDRSALTPGKVSSFCHSSQILGRYKLRQCQIFPSIVWKRQFIKSEYNFGKSIILTWIQPDPSLLEHPGTQDADRLEERDLPPSPSWHPVVQVTKCTMFTTPQSYGDLYWYIHITMLCLYYNKLKYIGYMGLLPLVYFY